MKKRISDLLPTTYQKAFTLLRQRLRRVKVVSPFRLRSGFSPAFTLIELIIIIVIIGILASVSYVAYVGLQSRARDTGVLSNIDNMDGLQTSWGIKNNGAGKAYYSGNGADAALGFTPSSGNVIDVVINSTDYCIRGYNTSGTKKTIFNAFTKESTVGICTTLGPSAAAIAAASSQIIAPQSPVADWLAITQGDHYGNFYNLVSNQYATVTRSTPKTIYDPTTQKIYDVPAGSLSVNPRSDGKSGSEAVIEEARTNSVLQSSFENTMSGWSYQYVANGSAISSTDKSLYGNYSLKITRTVAASESNVYNSLSGLENSTVYSYSFWAWASTANTACLYTFLGTVNMPVTCHSGSSQWERLSGAFTSTATGTIQLRLVHTNGSPNLNSVYFDAVQVEKGSFATSYIPTTTAAFTRNADVVTVPTTGWNTSAGTLLGVAGDSPGLYESRLMYWADGTNRIGLCQNSATSLSGIVQASGVAVRAYAPTKTAGTSGTLAMSWDGAGNRTAFWNGTAGTTLTGGAAPTGLAATTTANIGSWGGSNVWDSSIQRLTVYTSALSSSNVTTVTNAIKDGPY